MATEEEVKLAERLAELEDKIRAGRAEEKDLAEEIRNLSEKQIEKLLQVSNLSEKIKAQLAQQLANENELLSKLEDRVKEAQRFNDTLKEELTLTNSKYTKAVLTDELEKGIIEKRRLNIKLLRQKLKEQKSLSDEEAKELANLEKLDNEFFTESFI